MTPKEKAKELVNKYTNLYPSYIVMFPGDTDNAIKDIKQGALTAVEFAREFITGDLNESFDKTMYLFEVKQEIEKL